MVAAISGCTREPGADAGVDSASPMVERRSDGVLIPSPESLRKVPGYVVDSILPPDRALARFRGQSPAPAGDSLAGGATSVRALMDTYVRALRSRDTLTIATLALTRAEFAWLYFDGSPDQKSGMMPQTVWDLLESRGNSGLGRATSRIAGMGEVRLTKVTCGPDRMSAGVGRIEGPCAVTIAPATGAAVTLPLARYVFTYRGRMKLVSFTNDL
jgi:hypothetical protein